MLETPNTSSATTVGENSIFTPPGGMAIWFFMVIELGTYAAAIVVFLIQRSTNLELFNSTQKAALNPTAGLLNTLILITSGFFVAEAVREYKAERLRQSSTKLFIGGTLGLCFLAVKTYEYSSKILAGHSIGDGGFLDYYWGLTGFHFMHVATGTIIIFAMALHLRRGKKFSKPDAGIEAGAAFWHLCDIIWVMIYPIFYLLH